jgi:hypothetical protein
MHFTQQFSAVFRKALTIDEDRINFTCPSTNLTVHCPLWIVPTIVVFVQDTLNFSS